MPVCPNCGAFNNGKFCENCGSPLPVEQPVQPVQQAQSQSVQPAQPIPVQPVYQQPLYQQPVQPVYQQPVYQQPVYQQPQSSFAPVKKQSTNGACIAGFILGLVGLITLGIPSLIGFIVSTIGVIVAFAKKQKGKVLGIIGMILSLLMIAGWILFIANADKIADALDANGEGQSFEEWLFSDSYDGKIEIISETEWIEKNNGSYLIFGADDNFKYYNDYRDLTDNYYSGTYEICFGYEAMDILEQKYGQYGYTSDDICDKISNERGVSGVRQFMILILHNDGYWINGENTVNLKWDTVYMGYYDENRLIMDLTYLEDETARTFVSSLTFDPSGIVMPTAAPAGIYGLGEDFWGSELSGAVELSEGEWLDSNGTDDMGYSYLDKVQTYNADTKTTIQLSVISGQYNPSYAEEIAEEFKATMENQDYAVSEVEETAIGGYTAYTVSVQYTPGEYFSVWFFVDEDQRLHYVTVEYYNSDTASYEMVRDTYVFKN